MREIRNGTDLIDGRPMGPFQWLIVVLCTLVMVVDGFDAQAIGYVAPALVKDLGFDRAALGPIFTSGLVGLGVGALGLGLLSDRVGRKPVMVASLLLFGVLTSLKAVASTVVALALLQFGAGLFIGGAYPTAVSLASEYVPGARRNMMVTVNSLGFVAGTSVGGILSASLIPVIGWRGIFTIGGLAPLILASVCLFGVPASVHQLAMRQGTRQRMIKILHRIAPDADLSGMTFARSDVERSRSPVAELFQGARGIYTVLIWLTIFMVLITTHFVFTWLPTLLSAAGVSVGRSILAATAFPIATAISSIILTMLLRQRWAPLALSVASILYGASLAVMGTLTGDLGLLIVAVFLAGLGNGVIGVTLALNIAVYPPLARSTGCGWAIGVGRLGAVFGPLLGGFLVQLQWTVPQILAAAAVPALVAALATALMWLIPDVRRLLHQAFQVRELPARASEPVASSLT